MYVFRSETAKFIRTVTEGVTPGKCDRSAATVG
jgi:hypothetical protein